MAIKGLLPFVKKLFLIRFQKLSNSVFADDEGFIMPLAIISWHNIHYLPLRTAQSKTQLNIQPCL